jgi:hypothetical protein
VAFSPSSDAAVAARGSQAMRHLQTKTVVRPYHTPRKAV